MATVHLVCGFLGVGKTTFAVALASQLGAVRFSVDELYLKLFADGPTYELDQREPVDSAVAPSDETIETHRDVDRALHRASFYHAPPQHL